MLMIIQAEVKGKDRQRTLSAFYETHKFNLFRYALRFTKNNAAAEDVFHTAWMKCLS